MGSKTKKKIENNDVVTQNIVTTFHSTTTNWGKLTIITKRNSGGARDNTNCIGQPTYMALRNVTILTWAGREPTASASTRTKPADGHGRTDAGTGSSGRGPEVRPSSGPYSLHNVFAPAMPSLWTEIRLQTLNPYIAPTDRRQRDSALFTFDFDFFFAADWVLYFYGFFFSLPLCAISGEGDDFLFRGRFCGNAEVKPTNSIDLPCILTLCTNSARLRSGKIGFLQ